MSTLTTMTTFPSFLIGLSHPFLPHLNLFFIARNSFKNTNWIMSPNCLIPFKGFTLFMGVEKQCPPHGLGSVPALDIAFPQPHSCHTRFDSWHESHSAFHFILWTLWSQQAQLFTQCSFLCQCTIHPSSPLTLLPHFCPPYLSWNVTCSRTSSLKSPD